MCSPGLGDQREAVDTAKALLLWAIYTAPHPFLKPHPLKTDSLLSTLCFWAINPHAPVHLFLTPGPLAPSALLQLEIDQNVYLLARKV